MYLPLLTEIDTIANENDFKDHRAFVYWFIRNNFEGFGKKEILDSICDGTHDKGIDAILVDNNEERVTVIQSKFEREGRRTNVKESDIKLLSTVREYFKSRSSLAPILSNANETSRKLLKEAFSAIRDKGYSLHLVFITTHKSAPGIDRLIKDTYGFKPGEFSIWHYDYILHLFEEERRDFTPSLGTYPLPYKDADKTMVRTGNYKSWVLTVPLEEIRYLVEKYRR